MVNLHTDVEHIVKTSSSRSPATETIWALLGWGIGFVVLLGFSPKLFHVQEYFFFSLLTGTVFFCLKEGKSIWVRTPYDIPLLGFLAWICLSIPFSVDPGLSLEEAPKALAQAAVFYGTCLIIRESSRNGDGRQVLWPILCGAFACYAYSLGDFWERGGNIWDREIRAGFPKADGTDITWLSINVLMVLPMLFAGLGMSFEWKSRGVWGAVFLLALLCLFFSYSRGAWLGALTQILLGVWLIHKRMVLKIAMIGAVCLSLLGSALVYVNLHSRIFDPSTVFGRLLVWELAAADVGAHPLVGIGYGNLVFEQRHQSDFVMQRTAHATVPDILTKPHSWYLSVAVGTGLPGLVLGCWLLGKIGLTVHAAFLKAENWDTRCWLFGVLLMLGGFSIRLLFEDGFGGSHSYLFWILVASSLMISTNSGAKSFVSRQVMG